MVCPTTVRQEVDLGLAQSDLASRTGLVVRLSRSCSSVAHAVLWGNGSRNGVKSLTHY